MELSLSSVLTRRLRVSLPKGTHLGRFLFLAALGFIAANFAVTGVFTTISRLNYPGGEALSTFHVLYANHTSPIHVHICDLAAQTGSSLFLHENPEWVYDKDEKGPRNASITHVIAEEKPTWGKWKEVAVVEGFERLDWSNLDIKTKEMLWIMERR